jgi:hypothetical protein
MDGPDIIRGPKTEAKPIRERIGGKLRVRNDAKDTAVNWDGGGVDLTEIGRLHTEFRVCYGPLDDKGASGTWRIVENQGSEVDSGQFVGLSVALSTLWPSFRVLHGEAPVHYIIFGDRALFTARRPCQRTTHHFPALKNKE